MVSALLSRPGCLDPELDLAAEAGSWQVGDTFAAAFNLLPGRFTSMEAALGLAKARLQQRIGPRSGKWPHDGNRVFLVGPDGTRYPHEQYD